jgi:hypothetical protein
MRAALDDLEGTIARIVKRVRWANVAWRRVAVQPPAACCEAVRETCAPAGVDSS